MPFEKPWSRPNIALPQAGNGARAHFVLIDPGMQGFAPRNFFPARHNDKSRCVNTRSGMVSFGIAFECLHGEAIVLSAGSPALRHIR